MTLIIVPFVDNAKVTIECLKSVHDTKTESDTVVAIANGSKDGTYEKYLIGSITVTILV